MRRKLFGLFCMLLVAVGLILVYVFLEKDRGTPVGGDSFTARVFVLDTAVSVTVYSDTDDNPAGEVSERILSDFHDLEDNVISRRTEGSELATLNAFYKAGEPYKVSPELYDALSGTLDVCRMSDGALDLTIAPLADAWGIEEKTSKDFTLPTKTEIREAFTRLGYEHVKLSDENRTVTIDEDGFVLDLGASGKGYALDIAYSDLRKLKPQGCVVDCGSSILLYGSKPDGSDYRIGLRDPKGGQNDMLGFFTFSKDRMQGDPVFCSTSGDYEKRITYEGKVYHHIMDRATGAPAESDLASVTVFAPTGLLSDALSTACYVLGEEDARKLLAAYGCEGCFVDKENRISMTDGLQGLFTEE